MTDVEFVEIRYSGKPAAFLRGFRSLYLGLFINCVIMGWVNLAMAAILQGMFDIPAGQVIWHIAGALLVTAILFGALGSLGCRCHRRLSVHSGNGWDYHPRIHRARSA